MSFYKMPPPWDPGYVIPKYVQAEPPQRGTFTTQWLPRGTIPALIPDYLAVPQRAGSTLAKHSLAGGCFSDNTLGGSSLSGDSLGASASEYDGAGPQAFTAYGKKVAASLMSRMKRLPEAQRGPVLKKALAAIDRTLPSRVEALAKAAQKAGATPQQALARGIAGAVSQGVVGELAAIGRNARVLPQARPLRGLGLTNMALGATRDAFDSALTRMGEPTKTSLTTAQPSTPAVGNCTPDGLRIWTGTSWQRKAASDACTGTFSPTVISSGSSAGGVTVTDSSGTVVTTTSPVVAPEIKPVDMISVGPFRFPKDATYAQYRWHAGGAGPSGAPHYLPEDWQAEIRRLFSSSLAGSSKISTAGYQMDKFVSGLPASFGNRFLFLAQNAPTQTLGSGNMPIFRAKHPVTGEDYGVFIGTGYSPSTVAIKDAQATLYIVWSKITQPSWYESVWNFIKLIATTIVDVVGDAVTAVKDATCELLTTPGIDQAAIGTAAGSPSVTSAGVAAGVVIGQQLCGGAQAPALPPTAPASGGGWLMPLAIGGGALLLYALSQR